MKTHIYKYVYIINRLIWYCLLFLELSLCRVEKEHLGTRDSICGHALLYTVALPLVGRGMDSLPDEKAKAPKQRKKRDVGSRLKLRSIAIQKFLLDETTGSEKSIRNACGDTPDTSKALRMLVKDNKVKRFGSGGRSNPFIYMALIPPSIRELELLNEADAMEPNDSIGVMETPSDIFLAFKI